MSMVPTFACFVPLVVAAVEAKCPPDEKPLVAMN